MPALAPLRVIADIHGQPDMLELAAGDAENILLLGDLVDNGPDSPGALRLALDWMDAGRAQLVQSNHDDKLRRALLGRDVKIGNSLGKTLNDLKAAPDSEQLITRFMAAIETTPYFIQHGPYVMTHGAIPARFFDQTEELPPPSKGDRHMALYAQVDGTSAPDGKPNRFYHWVDDIPQGYTAIVGHDRRSQPDVFIQTGKTGGRAIFLDTGCGKGGPLSFIDLPDETIGQIPQIGTE